MKRIAFFFAAFCLFSTTVFAAKTTYIVTNKRFNFVKIREVSDKVAAKRQMTHPATVDEAGLRAALASINMERSFVIKKEADTQRIFDDVSIDYLAPALVKAFATAKSNEEIDFSYLMKHPYIIIRNDRLNICTAWIHDDELHIKFDKLFAKITGDTDKRGNEDRAIARSRGLRVKLELGEGQMLGKNDTDEIVLNMHYNYVKKPEAPKEPEAVTMSGEKADEAQGAPAENPRVKGGKKGLKEKSARAEIKPDAKPEAGDAAPAGAAAKSPKERLEMLEQLRKDKLIDKDEYNQKKQEILKEL